MAQSKARRFLRKLIKIGIPTLEVLKEKMHAHIDKVASSSSRPSSFVAGAPTPLRALQSQTSMSQISEMDAVPNAPPPSPRSLQSQVSMSAISESEVVNYAPALARALQSQLSTSQTSDAGAAAGPPTPARRVLQSQLTMSSDAGTSVSQDDDDAAMSQVGAPPQMGITKTMEVSTHDMISFLESIGLWEEAKQLRAAPEKRRSAQKGKAPNSNGTSASSNAGQHYLLRSLKWVAEAESVDQLVQQLHLSGTTADEQAVQALAAASRTFVPALKEIRNAATDRVVLEGLAKGKNRQLVTRLSCQGEETSDGESSACDFGVSDASSGEEAKAAAPLVLPPSWKTEVVRRGNRMQREYIDGRGQRYKTEQQARRVVDAMRRSANMTQRLHQRFEDRLKAQNTENVITTASETPEQKRLRVAGVEVSADASAKLTPA